MAERIELPQTPAGSQEEQMRQMYNYLYRVAQALNHNLAEIGSMDLTDGEREVMNGITGAGSEDSAGGADYEWAEKESLKSLIIKTASFVQNTLNTYRISLLGEYVADGKFGRYVRNTGLKVDVTPEGIQQDYTFEEVVQGLKTYSINAKNYIKTGLLRTVGGLPVYGVAIGKDVVTFSQDGTETYNDGNKVAELTADELSFWLGGNKIASYKGNRISFLYGGNEAFYIQAGKIYCENDLELASGKKLIIDTENFKITSAGKVTIKGDGEFSGDLSAAGGTFAGDLSAAGGTFAGNLSAAGGTFRGDLEAADGTFKVDATNKEIVMGRWTIDDSGEVYDDPEEGKFEIRAIGDEMLDSTAGIYYDLTKTLQGLFDAKVILKTVHGYANNYETRKLIFGYISDMTFRNLPCLYADTGIDIVLFKPDKPADILYANTISGNSTDNSLFLSPCDDITRSHSRIGLFLTKKNSIVQCDLSFNCMNASIGIDQPVDYIYGLEMYANNYNQNSSREVKHDIRELDSQGERLDRLRPVRFAYDRDPEKTRFGLIYEDTLEVMPEICRGDPEGRAQEKAISYMDLIPMLLKEIQELRARVKALEEKTREDK